MIDSPWNLALLGLSITSQPGAASPWEGGPQLLILGALLGWVLAGAVCSPNLPPLSISEASGCPLGQHWLAPKGMRASGQKSLSLLWQRGTTLSPFSRPAAALG